MGSHTRGLPVLCGRCREVTIPAMYRIDHCTFCDQQFKRALVLDKVVIRSGDAEVYLGRELGELLAYDEYRYRHLYHIKCVLFQRFSPFRRITFCYNRMAGNVLPRDYVSTRIMSFL